MTAKRTISTDCLNGGGINDFRAFPACACGIAVVDKKIKLQAVLSGYTGREVNEMENLTFCAEWIDYMEAYRVFWKSSPNQTIAYESNISNIREYANLIGLPLEIIE